MKLSKDVNSFKWVNSEAIKYRPYVRNKVIEIQELQPVDVWDYIPSAKNKAADLISKGCNIKDIPIILEGPEILRKPMKFGQLHRWKNVYRTVEKIMKNLAELLIL